MGNVFLYVDYSISKEGFFQHGKYVGFRSYHKVLVYIFMCIGNSSISGNHFFKSY